MDAPSIRLACSVSKDGRVEIQCIEGSDPDLWSAIPVCVEALTGPGTCRTSSDGCVIVLPHVVDAKTTIGYVKAAEASINLLFQLGLIAPEAARVLKNFPNVVSFVDRNGPTNFRLNSHFGGKPPIKKLPSESIVQFTAALIDAGYPGAGCNLLVHCGTKLKYLMPLVLSQRTAAFGHWPHPRSLLIQMLKQVGNQLQPEGAPLLRDLIASRELPSWIKEALAPQLPEDTRVKEAREAADKARTAVEALRVAWVMETDSPASMRRVLLNLPGKPCNDMSRLRDLARVLAAEFSDDGFKTRLADELAQVARERLLTAWGMPKAKPWEFLTEIPEASESAPPRDLLPFLYVVHTSFFLGAAQLAIWLPMLADIEKHRWRDTEAAKLKAILDEILAALFQAREQKQLPEIEIESALQTLNRIYENVSAGFGIPYTASSATLLDGPAGYQAAMQECEILLKPCSDDDVLRGRGLTIQRALGTILRGEDADASVEMTGGEQQAILDALLDDPAWRSFVHWMAKAANYDVLQTVMVSLLGPKLHLEPAKLYLTLFAAPTDHDRFALAVAICPLVPTLPLDDSAQGLADLLTNEWSYRQDGLRLILEACVGSGKPSTWDELRQACKALKMYPFLLGTAAIRKLLSGAPADVQSSVDQFCQSREGTRWSLCLPMSVLADCVLRFDLRNTPFLKEVTHLLSQKVRFTSHTLDEPTWIYDALNGAPADPWRRLEFSILISALDEDGTMLAAGRLCSAFPKQRDEKRLQATIFRSKLSPLPGTSVEQMTQVEKERWKEKFTDWLSGFHWNRKMLLRVCVMILSHLIDSKVSVATMGYVMTVMEEESSRHPTESSFADLLSDFRTAMKARKREARNDHVITLPLPPSAHGTLQLGNVPSLTEVGQDLLALAQTVDTLIQKDLLYIELQMMVNSGALMRQPNLLLALLMRARLYGGYSRPSPEQLAWLGEQCCTWTSAGSEFVRLLSDLLHRWSDADWVKADPEQLAAFMSGVLRLTVRYLDLKPMKFGENRKALHRLTKLVDMSFDRCIAVPTDAEHFQNCLELRASLKMWLDA
ncbi:hypothetical protein [Variovorax defluvii]